MSTTNGQYCNQFVIPKYIADGTDRSTANAKVELWESDKKLAIKVIKVLLFANISIKSSHARTLAKTLRISNYG